jgi:hypothetical protein
LIKLEEVRTDDLTGKSGKDVETVEFSLDGTAYAMELNPANSKALRRIYAEYIPHARKARPATLNGMRARVRAVNGSGPNGTRNYAAKKLTTARSTEIRDWAKQQGLKVNDRGRIAATVVKEFDLAHPA